MIQNSFHARIFTGMNSVRDTMLRNVQWHKEEGAAISPYKLMDTTPHSYKTSKNHYFSINDTESLFESEREGKRVSLDTTKRLTFPPCWRRPGREDVCTRDTAATL